LLLKSPSPINAAVFFALPPEIAIAVTLAASHCHLRHHWPLQSPSPLAITVALAIIHCQELLPWCGENSI
jgi:hypothetical protein